MSLGDVDDFARRELEGFFRRRAERGKVYCGACLAEQLTQRGAQGILPATWTAAIEDVFERPGSLRVELGSPCAACKNRRRCVGAPRPGPSAPP